MPTSSASASRSVAGPSPLDDESCADGSTISTSARDGEMTTTSSVTWRATRDALQELAGEEDPLIRLRDVARRVFAASRPRCGTMILEDTRAGYRSATRVTISLGITVGEGAPPPAAGGRRRSHDGREDPRLESHGGDLDGQLGIDLVEDEAVDEADARTWPSDARRAGLVAERREHPVGWALSARPPTIGLTAKRGASVERNASRTPGSSRVGPMLTIGFDGPMTTSSAVAIASMTARVARAPSPSNRTPRTTGSWRR